MGDAMLSLSLQPLLDNVERVGLGPALRILRAVATMTGARIDDLALIKYRETVDPKSPPIVLLAPSGSPHPFYSEFGWVVAAEVVRGPSAGQGPGEQQIAAGELNLKCHVTPSTGLD